nr:Phage-related protein, predicted endonuclease (COG5377) [uncultured Mediterranean phage uvMED]
MKLLKLDQGSEQWLQARENYFCASDASAMMGDSPYKSRDALIKEKATGIKPVTSRNEFIFKKGHEAEAKARPLAEKLTGCELHPVVGVEGDYLASFDGMKFDQSLIFEHKLVSQSLIEQIQKGQLNDHYLWQLEHQLLVSNAEKALFVASDGTADNFHSLSYVSSPDRRQQLIEGWKKLKQDIDEWVTPERTDDAYREAAEDYRQVKKQRDEAVAAEERAKKRLIELTEGARESSGFGVTIRTVTRKGSIDYKQIPGIGGLDLELYRKPPSEYFKVTVNEQEAQR